MSISTSGHFYYRDVRPGQGGIDGWRYAPHQTMVWCDEPGCDVHEAPKGVEHNGPVIDTFYGLNGWYMRERDLCPKHAPKPEEGGDE